VGVETNDVKSAEATCDIVGKTACIIHLILIKDLCQDFNHWVFHTAYLTNCYFIKTHLCYLVTPHIFFHVYDSTFLLQHTSKKVAS